jgi:hypothetical protein
VTPVVQDIIAGILTKPKLSKSREIKITGTAITQTDHSSQSESHAAASTAHLNFTSNFTSEFSLPRDGDML